MNEATVTRWAGVMTKRERFESGTVLPKGHRVVVTHEHKDWLGIEWNDAEGGHVAAVTRDKVRRGW